jgi:hypothetical protein
MLRIFSPEKIRRFRPGANPRSWVPEASMLTTRLLKPLFSACYMNVDRNVHISTVNLVYTGLDCSVSSATTAPYSFTRRFSYVLQ